ncbi:unnamed protein product, partial [Oppiella nova]
HPMPGFDSKRFIGLEEWLAKELECSICLHVFDKAVDTICCHTFCRDCIQQTIVNNRLVCPQCRHESVRKRQRSLTAEAQCHDINESLFRSNRRIDGIVQRLRTNCDFEDKGCDEVLELGHLSAHLEKCNYNLCENCGLKVGKRVDHNCLELMKNERKRFMNTIIGYKFKLNQTNKRLKTLELRNKELEEEVKRFTGAVDTTPTAVTPTSTSGSRRPLDLTKNAKNSRYTPKAGNYGFKTGKIVRNYGKTFNILTQTGEKKSVFRMKTSQTFDDFVKHVAKTFETDDQLLKITYNTDEAIAISDTITKLNIPSNRRTLKAVYNDDQMLVNIIL